MAFQDLSIFEKTYELALWLYPAVARFPKNQRFVLGQRLENRVLALLEGIIEANQDRDKMPHLRRISNDLDTFRILLRFAKDMRFISIRQYAFAAEQVNAIGKMLGGWMRSCQ